VHHIGFDMLSQFKAKIYITLTKILHFVNGDEWCKFSTELRNHGSDSHQFDVMPHVVGGDSPDFFTLVFIPILKGKAFSSFL